MPFFGKKETFKLPFYFPYEEHMDLCTGQLLSVHPSCVVKTLTFDVGPTLLTKFFYTYHAYWHH